MNKKWKCLVLLLVFALTITGCSTNNSGQEKPKLLVKEVNIDAQEVKVGETAELKVKLANVDPTNCNYDWKLLSKAGSLIPDGRRATYQAPEAPGKYKVKVIVSNNTLEPVSVNKTIVVKDKLTAGVADSFTANYADSILANQNFTIKGEVSSQVEKLKVKVDGYALTNKKTNKKWVTPNQEGKYKLTYSFYQTGTNRKLTIEAYNSQGKLVDKIQDKIDVVNKKLTADYPQNIFINQEFKVTGKVGSGVEKIKVKVDGYALTDKKTDKSWVQPDENGNYTLAYSFQRAEQDRSLKVAAYDSQGQVVDTIKDSINVKERKKQLTVELPNQIIVGEEFEITGQTSPQVKKIGVKLDGWKITDDKVEVKDGSYLVKTNLNTAGKDRELVVRGYDQQGKQIIKQSTRITVLSNQELTLDLPQKVEKGKTIEISGQALEPITKVHLVADGKYTLTKEIEVENGRYNYSYTFNTAGNNRELTAIGYNGAGEEVARETVEFNIQGDKNVVMGVPYFNQLRNDYKPLSTCQNTAMAMVLGYYGWKGEPDDIYEVHAKSAQSAVEFEDIFNEYARDYGFSVRLQTFWERSEADLKRRIRQGRPVVLHGRFTSAGHVVVLVGYDEEHFYINDPAGRWNEEVYGGYNYDVVTDGEYVKYDQDVVMAAVNAYDTMFTHEVVDKSNYSRYRYVPNFLKQKHNYSIKE